MFTERLRIIFDTINASSADIAACAGCDTSNISRMHSGARIPRRDGIALRRLSKGIYQYAAKNGCLSSLATLLSIKPDTEEADFKNALTDWMYEGTEQKGRNSLSRDNAPYKTFGNKLNTVMKLAELSNIRLARLVNIDASYISRFRSGLRSPKSNPKTANAICTVLLERLHSKNRMDKLYSLMAIPAAAIEDDDELFLHFRSWLYEADIDGSSPVIGRFLEHIDSFDRGELQAAEPLSDPAIQAAPYQQTLYFGNEGLQQASLRFLREVSESSTKEVMLYCDQENSWLTRDNHFAENWNVLMSHCLRNNIKVHIIHNIDRDSDEMTAALNSWIPLYMSGLIDSYYSVRQRDHRFSHTLFLCPGRFCIQGMNIAGAEEQNAVYQYLTDPMTVTALQSTFDGLLSSSRQLVRICSESELDSYLLSRAGDSIMISPNLSLGTMPEVVIQNMLDRSSLDQHSKQAVLRLWNKNQQQFFKLLQGGTVQECIPTIGKNETVTADLYDIPLTYTPEEYTAHLNYIKKMTEEIKNYRVYQLPKPLLKNTKLLISDNSVLVSCIRAPRLHFTVSHPSMVKAFMSYGDHLLSICLKLS